MRSLLHALRRIYPLLGLRPWTLALLIALGLLAALLEAFSISLIVPLLAGGSEHPGRLGAWLSSLFQDLSPERRTLFTGLLILVGIALKNILSYAYSLYFNWVNSGIGHRLRSGIIAQTLAVSQQYLDSRDSSRLLNTLGTETWRVATALSFLADMLINACLVSIYALLLLALSWKLALASLAFFGLVSFLIHLLTARIQRLGREATEANASLAHRMLEVLGGLRVVRLFGNESWEQKRYDEASRGVRATFFRMDSVSSLVGPLSEILAAVFLIGVLLLALGSRAELAGTLVFLVVLYRFQARMKTLDGQRVTLCSLSASVEDVAAFLERGDKPYIASGHAPVASLEPGLAFEQVSLHYESNTVPALEQVSFLLKAHRTTALVGASGAGKSTVASLVCRLYDPTAGRILVGDRDLRELDLAAWRSRLAVVSQDVHLFNASVEENIAYGKPSASRAEIEEAARRAQALDFIHTLPEGFATRLGDRGVRLSGGQKQRLALARALIRDPDILILDEATNSLDLASERLVQDALEAFSTGKTVLIIAHRLVTIEHADEVIVLESGRVAEIGSPADLARRGGPFARLCALQYSAKKEIGESRV